MDRPVAASLTPDPNGVSTAEQKCRQLMAATHKSQSFEDLLSLPVHFNAHNAAVPTPKGVSGMGLHNTSLQSVLLDSTVFEQWRQFGTSNGLATDSSIAAYLLHHFETSQSLTRCIHCQATLPLSCPKCTLGSTLTSAASTNPALTVPQASPSLDLKQVPGSFSAAAPTGPGNRRLCETKRKALREGTQCVDNGEGQAAKNESSLITPKAKPAPRKRPRRTDELYRCVDCNQAFPYRILFEEHLYSQQGAGSFKCRHCQTVILTPGDVHKHALVHTAETPYKCQHCSLAFSQPSILKTHLRIHSGERPFPCEVCGRAFSQRVALKVHMRKHTGERPFPCPHCPMAFAAYGNLSRHLLKHTGQKPYSCTFCPATFSQSGSLKTHTRSKHTGERPYVCERCAAAFSDHSTLWKHRRNNTCLKYRQQEDRQNDNSATGRSRSSERGADSTGANRHLISVQQHSFRQSDVVADRQVGEAQQHSYRQPDAIAERQISDVSQHSYRQPDAITDRQINDVSQHSYRQPDAITDRQVNDVLQHSYGQPDAITDRQVNDVSQHSYRQPDAITDRQLDVSQHSYSQQDTIADRQLGDMQQHSYRQPDNTVVDRQNNDRQT